MNPHEKRFNHYKNLNIKFKNVLDIGAYEGHWSRLFTSIYPDANVLMIEANKEKEKTLKEIGNYRIALLGEKDNETVDYYKCLDGVPTGNGIYQENTEFKFTPEKRRTITLPTLLGSEKGFDLIKMDVQGSELNIIKGALPIIKNTKYLLLELQTFQYNKGAPQIEEVVSYLHGLNFGFVDLFDLMYSNNHLIQVDGLFINKDINDS
jgi:FkbM family methyltransferase